MKKTIAIFISVILMVSCWSLTAFADEDAKMIPVVVKVPESWEPQTFGLGQITAPTLLQHGLAKKWKPWLKAGTTFTFLLSFRMSSSMLNRVLTLQFRLITLLLRQQL